MFYMASDIHSLVFFSQVVIAEAEYSAELLLPCPKLKGDQKRSACGRSNGE